jgi:hypothetical protein
MYCTRSNPRRIGSNTVLSSVTGWTCWVCTYQRYRLFTQAKLAGIVRRIWVIRKAVLLESGTERRTIGDGLKIYVGSLQLYLKGKLCLTVFLASSWGHVNRLGRSYVTQGDRKFRDLPPSPCHCSAVETPAGSRVFLTPPLPGRHRLEIGKSVTFPSLPPATLVQHRHRRVPRFSRLHLSRAGIVSYWPERAAHSQSEWRRTLPLW